MTETPIDFVHWWKLFGRFVVGNRRVYVLITWDEGMPMVRSMEDEHEAIEMLKDAMPIRERAYLFVSDEYGNMEKVEGW